MSKKIPLAFITRRLQRSFFPHDFDTQQKFSSGMPFGSRLVRSFMHGKAKESNIPFMRPTLSQGNERGIIFISCFYRRVSCLYPFVINSKRNT